MAGDTSDENPATNAGKRAHLTWLAQLYSHHPDATSEQAADEHLFDRMNDFGMDQFLATYRPLVKLREQRGPVTFELGATEAPRTGHQLRRFIGGR